MRITLANVVIDPHSIGGTETCIQLPGYKLAFDIGVCNQNAHKIPNVFITHGHLDHLGSIITHCVRRNVRKLTPTRYFIPKCYYNDLLQLFDVWKKIDGSKLKCEITPLSAGQKIDIGKGRKVRAFKSKHTVYTLGYAVTSKVKKLKPKYFGLKGPELGRLRKSGVDIQNEIEMVETAFCGDTTINVMRDNEFLRKARLLMLECTFLRGDVSAAEAKKFGHNHIDDIINHADYFDDVEHLLLTHFSGRYSNTQLYGLESILPEKLLNKTSVLHHDGTVHLVRKPN